MWHICLSFVNGTREEEGKAVLWHSGMIGEQAGAVTCILNIEHQLTGAKPYDLDPGASDLIDTLPTLGLVCLSTVLDTCLCKSFPMDLVSGFLNHVVVQVVVQVVSCSPVWQTSWLNYLSPKSNCFARVPNEWWNKILTETSVFRLVCTTQTASHSPAPSHPGRNKSEQGSGRMPGKGEDNTPGIREVVPLSDMPRLLFQKGSPRTAKCQPCPIMHQHQYNERAVATFKFCRW